MPIPGRLAGSGPTSFGSYPPNLHDGLFPGFGKFATDAWRSLSESGIYNVRSFGAHGDGVTNDTVACQAAINACAAAGGGVIYFPPGTYAVTGLAVTLDASCPRLAIVGAGQASTILATATVASLASGCIAVTNTGSSAEGSNWFQLADIYLQGSATCGPGLYLVNVVAGEIRNVIANGFTAPTYGVGFELDGCYAVGLYNCDAINNGAGLNFTNASNANTVVGGWYWQNAYGIVDSCEGNAYYTVIIQQNTTAGLYMDGYAGFYNCYFEQNGTYHILMKNGPNRFVNCIFNYADNINLEAGNDNIFDSCAFSNTTFTVATGLTGNRIYNGQGLALSAITDNSGGVGLLLRDNPSINPVGVVTVAVPATTVAVAAAMYDRTFYIKTGDATSTFVVQGGPTVAPTTTGALVTLFVPANLTMTPTYTTAPTWVVEGN